MEPEEEINSEIFQSTTKIVLMKIISGGQTGADQAGLDVEFEVDDGEVSVENSADGTYSVVIFGAADRDFHVDVGYQDAATTEFSPLWGYYGAGQIAFDVIVNSGSTPRVTIIPPARSPENLQADPVSAGGGTTNTVLSWNASTEPGVTGYNIYSAGETDPYFTKITTVSTPATSYTTTDPWAGDGITPVKIYAVTAVKSDGKESFFSNREQNNDRDHDLLTDDEEAGYGTDMNKPDTDGDGFTDYEEIYAGSDPLDKNSVPGSDSLFPWPMFLPAIIGGQQ